MSADLTEPSYRCIACGEAVSAAMSSECNWCDGRFHLNPRNDIEAKDCGRVWLDEQHLSLQFACNTCLGAAEGAREPRRRAVRPASPRQRRYRRRA